MKWKLWRRQCSCSRLLIGWPRSVQAEERPVPLRGPAWSWGPRRVTLESCPPTHLSSAPLHTAAEMGNSAMSIQVTFEAGAKLSSLGPGLQQRAPKTPAGQGSADRHLGPAGKQAFPFCFTGKFELSKTEPTPAAIWIPHSPAAKFRVQVTQNSSWRSLPKYWGFMAFKRGASACSAGQMRPPRSATQTVH